MSTSLQTNPLAKVTGKLKKVESKILISLLFVANFVVAQNLIVNGGFERQAPREAGVWQAMPKPCNFSSQAAVLNTNALGWHTFLSQTPDLLEWDSTINCPIFPAPRRGKRMVGLIMYHPFQDGQFAFDYHELIQGSLARPLEKGKTYNISFWVYTNDSLGVQHLTKVFGKGSLVNSKNERLSPGGFRPIVCGNFGFYFSNNKIQDYEEFMESQVTFPVKPQVNYAEIVETKGEWRKISIPYTPDQSYRYFLFGNFFSDAITPINMGAEERMQLDEKNQKLFFWAKNKRIAYYLFDDFAIVENTGTNIEQALLKEKRYTFEAALLFDTGMSDLKPESQPAIDGLAAALMNNPSMKIEISGHTDDIGNVQSNQTLSEKRALAVFDALIAKQVPAGQIAWKGYGESKPIAQNNTEAGKQKNRRVECIVL